MAKTHGVLAINTPGFSHKPNTLLPEGFAQPTANPPENHQTFRGILSLAFQSADKSDRLL